MTEQTELINGNRIIFMDNLRTLIIFLVVLVHAGFVYNGVLPQVWIVNDSAYNTLSFIIFMIIDIFMMPTLFFISGYLVPLSLERNQGLKFIQSKFKRLYLPWVFAVLTLIPLYKVIFLYSRNLPQEKLLTYFHFNQGFVSQNWLWFLPVLFLFNVLYFLFAQVKPAKFSIAFPWAVFTAFWIGVAYTFIMGVLKLEGWTLTPLLDFQNERLLIYLMIFLLGALGYQQKIFAAEPKNKKLYYLISCVVWLPVITYIFFSLNLLFNPGSYITSRIGDEVLVYFCRNLSMLGLLYVLINTFRYYLNRRGRFLIQLNKNSYGVYIIHMIVMGWIAMAMLNTTIHSTIKYLALTLLTFVISNLLTFIFRKVKESFHQ